MNNRVKVNFRTFQSGDEGEIIQLLELAYKRWPNFDLSCSPVDHWIWKNIDNPLRTSSSLIEIAELNNQIVGFSSSSPRMFKVGVRYLLCGQSIDLAVHPKFRGLGISAEIIKMNVLHRKKAGLKFVYAATRNPLLIKSSKRAQTMKEFPLTVKHYARIRDVGLHLEKVGSKNVWIKRLGLQSIKTLRNLRNVMDRSSNSQEEYHISKVYSFNDKINIFWNEIKEQYDFINCRTKDFLNWRYSDSRAGNYIIKIAEDKESIVGYVVYRINSLQEDYHRGYIVDLLSLPDRPDIAKKLAKAAIQDFDERNINMVNIWIGENHPNEKIFKKLGFVDIGLSPYLYYNATDIELPELTSIPPSCFFFSYGDIDWI